MLSARELVPGAPKQAFQLLTIVPQKGIVHPQGILSSESFKLFKSGKKLASEIPQKQPKAQDLSKGY